MSALSGGDLTHDVGYTESAMTGSLFQLCMMDEAIGWSRRITRGIEVNDETLAVSVINDVGPNGHYLRQKHTRKFFKTEFWYPNLHDRHNFDEWERTGSLTMRDRVDRPCARYPGDPQPVAAQARNPESHPRSDREGRRPGQESAKKQKD